MRSSNLYQLYRKTGSQIAEVPPALMLLLFIFFFPLLNMLYLFCAFGAGWYLNSMELREVACRPPLASPPTGNPTPVANLNSSLHWNSFMGVTEIAPPDVTQTADFYSGSNPNLTGKSWVVTHVSIRPFLIMPLFTNIPWLSQVPGLGKPIKFNYVNTVMQEDSGQ